MFHSFSRFSSPDLVYSEPAAKPRRSPTSAAPLCDGGGHGDARDDPGRSLVRDVGRSETFRWFFSVAKTVVFLYGLNIL